MLKYFVFCLLAVSCQGVSVVRSNDDDQKDPEDEGYANAFIKVYGLENEMFPAETCVQDLVLAKYKLYTRETPNGQVIDTNSNQTLKNSSFNVNHDTKILIHDWLQNETFSYFNDYVSAYLKNKKEYVNVITVDYGSVSRCHFYLARFLQPSIAVKVGKLLNSLIQYGSVPSKFHLIGLGMGAQIAGLSSKQIYPKKVGRLTALDPTFIGYKKNHPQLSTNDADYVDVIHTALRKMEIGDTLGRARYFPNDGTRQPVANNISGPGANLVAGVLSHLVSAIYYLESIVDITYFKARKCNNYNEYMTNRCPEPAVLNYMGDVTDISSKGKFYLKLNASVPPFGSQKPFEAKEFEINYPQWIVKERETKVIDNANVAEAKQIYEKKNIVEKSYTSEEIIILYNEFKTVSV